LKRAKPKILLASWLTFSAQSIKCRRFVQGGRVDIDRVVYDTASLEVAERTIELCEVHGIELPNYLESKAGLYQDQLILEESHRRKRLRPLFFACNLN
jgi:hypothetical protein